MAGSAQDFSTLARVSKIRLVSEHGGLRKIFEYGVLCQGTDLSVSLSCRKLNDSTLQKTSAQRRGPHQAQFWLDGVERPK
jgi:hypothetical protein